MFTHERNRGGLWIALGTGIGTAIGVTVGQASIGLALGVGLGVAASSFVRAQPGKVMRRR